MASLLSYALTTLVDVKETLGISAGDTSKDNLIIRKINQATDMIEGFCALHNGRHLAETTYTDEEYDGTGTNQLILKSRPIITLSQLQQRDTTTNENDWTTVGTELYFTDVGAGVLDALFTFTKHWNRYRVTYDAGFATIPSDLSEACVTLAAYLVDNATTGSGVKRKEEGQREIEYFQPMQGASLIEQLGLDDSLSRYCEPPILAHK